MSCTWLPKGVLHELNKIMARFIYSTKHRQWVSLDKIAMPYEEGGLELRSFTQISDAYGVKQAWSPLENKSLCAFYDAIKVLHL